eukprot:8057467-Pyramimonas_sp.AAC.1
MKQGVQYHGDIQESQEGGRGGCAPPARWSPLRRPSIPAPREPPQCPNQTRAPAPASIPHPLSTPFSPPRHPLFDPSSPPYHPLSTPSASVRGRGERLSPSFCVTNLCCPFVLCCDQLCPFVLCYEPMMSLAPCNEPMASLRSEGKYRSSVDAREPQNPTKK